MLLLRCVCGDNKGMYYAGLNSAGMEVVWTNSADTALKVAGKDAAGIVMAMIDGPRFVAVPERLADTTDAECGEFSSTAANGMFQTPTAMAEVISKIVRTGPTQAIYDQPEDLPASSGYMSVWEWLQRAMVATLDRKAEEVNS